MGKKIKRAKPGKPGRQGKKKKGGGGHRRQTAAASISSSTPSSLESPSDVEEENESDPDTEAESSSPRDAIGLPPPVLYRDAIQSVVRLLPLVDVGRCMAVSRLWSSAVRSTASMQTAVNGVRWSETFLQRVCASPLARHIGSLQFDDRPSVGYGGLNARWIDRITRGFPNLTALSCVLVPASNERLNYTFPPRLTSLQLVLRFRSVIGEQSVINAIGELAHLQRLALLIDRTDYSASGHHANEFDVTGEIFAPLVRLQQLAHFTYHVKRTAQQKRDSPGDLLLSVDIECIRRMPALTSLSLFNGGKSSDEPLRVLPQLLPKSNNSSSGRSSSSAPAAPTLQLQSFDLRHATRMREADFLSLTRFSSLTRLCGSFRVADFSPLRGLTRLTEVDVDLAPVEEQQKVDTQLFFESIQANSNLTKLAVALAPRGHSHVRRETLCGVLFDGLHPRLLSFSLTADFYPFSIDCIGFASWPRSLEFLHLREVDRLDVCVAVQPQGSSCCSLDFTSFQTFLDSPVGKPRRLTDLEQEGNGNKQVKPSLRYNLDRLTFDSILRCEFRNLTAIRTNATSVVLRRVLQLQPHLRSVASSTMKLQGLGAKSALSTFVSAPRSFVELISPRAQVRRQFDSDGNCTLHLRVWEQVFMVSLTDVITRCPQLTALDLELPPKYSSLTTLLASLTCLKSQLRFVQIAGIVPTDGVRYLAPLLADGANLKDLRLVVNPKSPREFIVLQRHEHAHCTKQNKNGGSSSNNGESDSSNNPTSARPCRGSQCFSLSAEVSMIPVRGVKLDFRDCELKLPNLTTLALRGYWSLPHLSLAATVQRHPMLRQLRLTPASSTSEELALQCLAELSKPEFNHLDVEMLSIEVEHQSPCQLHARLMPLKSSEPDDSSRAKGGIGFFWTPPTRALYLELHGLLPSGALWRCIGVGITELTLSQGDATAAEIADCLLAVPLLRKLTLIRLRNLSLSFLASPPLALPLLTHLTILRSRLNPRELLHLRALASLTHLRLLDAFAIDLDPFTIAVHTPPSLMLPQLQAFEYSKLAPSFASQLPPAQTMHVPLATVAPMFVAPHEPLKAIVAPAAEPPTAMEAGKFAQPAATWMDAE